jgi:hypothetical protein
VARGMLVQDVSDQQVLETYGARDVWQLDLNAGNLIQVDVEAVNPAQFNVMVELIAPNGDVWFDDNSGEGTNARLANVEAPVDGTYTVHIAGNNNASIGAYEILYRDARDLFTLTPSPTFTATPPTPGAPNVSFAADVAPQGTYVYFIEATEGQDVNLFVQGIENFDPILRVYDPTATLIVDVDDVGTDINPRARFAAPATGLYRIEVSGFEGSAGRFTLNYIVR